MSSVSTAPATGDTQPLSAIERITNMFFAPSKTFKDLNRDNSWWQPFLLIAVFAYLFVFAVQIKVGYDQVTRNEIAASQKAQDRLDKLAPEARENAIEMQ